MIELRRVCVFAGSSPGARSEYLDVARALGRALAGRNYELVYGGANVGLMGAIADSVLENEGHVIGVIPETLVKRKVVHRGLSDLRVVRTMHERKGLMAELSDGFIGLPGGVGTIEEFFEVFTWTQLGLHSKPCGLLNVYGYYERLIQFLDHAVEEQFLKPEHRAMLLVEQEPQTLLDHFTYCLAPTVNK